MATSKIKAIKSTLKKAIDYIVNPDKTDGGQLVYSHGCSVETADLEMSITAKQGTGRGDRIAYHLMQAFSPEDDISPEKALELGIEFAQRVTGGKCEFVIATHIDKDHTHNHIIFNSVDYVNHRKYHSDTKDKYRIRDINDDICKANNLSVLPKYDAQRKFKFKNTYKEEKIPWIRKLQIAIDQAIQTSDTFEDFLLALEMEGFERNTTRKKFLSFRAPGQERFTRVKTIGDNYTEEAIRERIKNKDKESIPDIEVSEKNTAVVTNENVDQAENAETINTRKDQRSKTTQQKAFYSKRINLLVDISKNIKAQQSKGYEQALVRSNINTLVKTMNFLIEHKITTSEDFQVYVDGKQAEYLLCRKDVRKIENELLDLSEKIKFAQNYKKNAAVYYESRRAKNKAEFARQHEDQIVMFKAAEMYFERKQLDPKTVNLTELFEQYKELKIEKSEMSKRSNSLRKEIDELDRVAQNIEKALGIQMSETREQPNSEKDKGVQDKQR